MISLRLSVIITKSKKKKKKTLECPRICGYFAYKVVNFALRIKTNLILPVSGYLARSREQAQHLS